MVLLIIIPETVNRQEIIQLETSKGMIKGTGIDTVSIDRISALIGRYGDRFLRKVFTEEEIAEGLGRKDSPSFFAARFAAREAFFKAIGTGWGRGIPLREVSVEKDESGRPRFRLSGRAEAALRERNVASAHLSLTHDGDSAQAMVIMEGVGP